MNTGAADPAVDYAVGRVLRMQTKLHRWAAADPGRRFEDVFNLVYDPSFLLVGWDRVRSNTGGRTAGVDGVRPRQLDDDQAGVMLAGIAEQLRSRTYQPSPVRAAQIPKANGKMRQLGIPSVADRVVQASLKLVLEPIFEADFDPASYGFRPYRRAQDAIAEIHKLASRPADYEWVFEADIKACFDNIGHGYLMGCLRQRIADKRVLWLIRAFLKAGVMSEDQITRATRTGTPQGGILSPLLANIALSGLDRHFRDKWNQYGPEWTRAKRRRQGGPLMRMVRYADDFVVLVHGSRADAEALFAEVAQVLAPAGLSLSEEKTRVVHIDEGFDFLGWRIQRRTKRGTNKKAVYTYPSKKAVQAIIDKIRVLTRRNSFPTLADLIGWLNPTIKGWCEYYKHGVSKAIFGYVDHYTFHRVLGWLLKQHPKLNKHTVVRRYMPGWRIADGRRELFRASKVPVTRYRYRGTRIPTPWGIPTV